jgi:hypothetical protein
MLSQEQRRQQAPLLSLAKTAGALCGCDRRIDTPGRRLLEIMRKLAPSQGGSAKVVLYGAGKHTSRLLSERQLWERAGHRIVGIIDDHPRYALRPVYMDLPVYSIADARDVARRGQFTSAIVLSTDTYEDQFWLQTAQLREAGVGVYRLY